MANKTAKHSKNRTINQIQVSLGCFAVIIRNLIPMLLSYHNACKTRNKPLPLKVITAKYTAILQDLNEKLSAIQIPQDDKEFLKSVVC